jgi:hypothetical protein
LPGLLHSWFRQRLQATYFSEQVVPRRKERHWAHLCLPCVGLPKTGCSLISVDTRVGKNDAPASDGLPRTGCPPTARRIRAGQRYKLACMLAQDFPERVVPPSFRLKRFTLRRQCTEACHSHRTLPQGSEHEKSGPT